MPPWRSANSTALGKSKTSTLPDEEIEQEDLPRVLDKLQVERFGADLSAFAKLQQFEATNPGPVEIRSGISKKTVVIVAKTI
jgi:hypothetical protein